MKRAFIKALASSSRVEALVRSAPITDELLSNYVAGTSVAEVHDEAEALAWRGLDCTVALLAEPARNPGEAEQVVQTYLGVLDSFGELKLGLAGEITVKASALGLQLPGGADIALANAERLCRAARNVGSDVTFEMEAADTVDATLDLVGEVRQDFPSTGVSLQAMLRRTEADLQRFCHDVEARVLLCKGLYKESSDVAYGDRQEVDLSFVRCLRTLMDSDCYPMIATHDPRLVNIAAYLAQKGARGADDWELRMLRGVRPLEQRRIADIGGRMRVYVPFGDEWYAYYVRALAGRDDNLRLFGRSLFERR